MTARSARRDKARALYVEGLPLSVIAKKLGATERTVARWKVAEGNGWERGRLAARASGEAIELHAQAYLGDFLAFQQLALDEITKSADLTPKEKVAAVASIADSYSKTVKACAMAAPKLSALAIAMEVIQRLAAFVSERYPEAAPLLLETLEPFGAELARTYGAD